jgi:hypothetical protein
MNINTVLVVLLVLLLLGALLPGRTALTGGIILQAACSFSWSWSRSCCSRAEGQWSNPEPEGSDATSDLSVFPVRTARGLWP